MGMKLDKWARATSKVGSFLRNEWQGFLHNERGEVALPLQGEDDPEVTEPTPEIFPDEEDEDDMDLSAYMDGDIDPETGEPFEREPEENDGDEEDTPGGTGTEDEPESDPNPAGKQEVTLNGQQFILNEHGDYCLNDGTPVYDRLGVPYANRAREAARHESKQPAQNPFAHANTPMGEQHDPEDIDPKTGLTYGQLDALKAEWRQEMQQGQAPLLDTVAAQHVESQLSRLRDDDGFADLFASPALEQQLREEINGLHPEAKFTPGVIENVAYMIMGNPENKKKFTNAAVKKSRTRRTIAKENRMADPSKPGTRPTGSGISAGLNEFINQTGLDRDDLPTAKKAYAKHLAITKKHKKRRGEA